MKGMLRFFVWMTLIGMVLPVKAEEPLAERTGCGKYRWSALFNHRGEL